MKPLALALVLAAAGCAGLRGTARRPGPNVVLVLADDLGYGELSCYGQQRFATPAIDRLAGEGMRFTQAYAGSSVCAPSRAVLLTGLHAGHAPIRANTPGYRRGSDFREGQAPLPADVPSLAEVLSARGYATAAVGKWGLGGPDNEGLPTRHGFDRFLGYLCQAHAHTYYPTHLWRDERSLELPNRSDRAHVRLAELPVEAGFERDYLDRVYAPDLLLDEALAFVRAHADEPFFLYYASPIPHAALQVPEAELARYAGAFAEEPYLGERGYLPHSRPRAAYAAMVTRLDHEVGRLVAELERLGIAEDTLVLITSDNGPTFNGGTDSAFFDSTAGLRGLKGSLYEGGLRVPLIAWWPGRIAAGGQSELLVSFQDVLPTLAELARADVPRGVDGLSIVPTLLGQPVAQPEHANLYWELGKQQALRAGDWKLVRTRAADGLRVELFDLASDPRESHDLAAERPALVARLIARAQRARRPDPRFPAPWDPPPGRESR